MAKQDEQMLLALTELGLSRRESSVYLATLELGHGTVTQISRKAGINRTTGYDILDRLSDDGLVSISGKEPSQEYVAESPDNIMALLKNRLARLEKNIMDAEKFIPKLKTVHKVENRASVKFYEGVDGLKQVYEDTLTAHEPIRAFARLEDMYAAMGDYFPAYYKRRAAKNIFARAITPRTPGAMERHVLDKEEKRELAIVPESVFTITPEIDIYDNKVMIASWKDKLGIIIESKEIAEGLKSVFELAWAEAKRLDAQTGSLNRGAIQ
ncbi:MAG: helix-turn-helix domain-containing protein [Patescibacteria group bacterium]